MAKNKVEQTSGLAFVGCIITGVGLGLIFDNPGAGSVLGTGAGFIIMAVMKSRS